jgi:hypothetical protein
LAVKVLAVAAGRSGQFDAPKEPVQPPDVGVPWVMGVFPTSPLTMDDDGAAGSVRPKSLSEIEPMTGAAWALPMANAKGMTAAPTENPIFSS